MIHVRTPAEVLLTSDHKMRAAWRLLLFVTVVALSLIVVSSVEYFIDGLMMARGYVPIVTNWGIPVAILVTTAIMLKWVEGTGWSFVWLGKESFNAAVMARGAIWGLAAIAIPSLILIASGELREVSSVPGSWWTAAGLSLANLLPAAASEELLLRGYVFAVLRDSVGWRWTLIATSIVFGLLHIPNPGSDAQSITLVMLAGFFLGSILLATRSLYATTLAHFAWNWFMAAGLHSPVSGLPVLAPNYQIVDAGPDWLTGGGWGPEGGLAAALGMFAILIYLHARPLRRMES